MDKKSLNIDLENTENGIPAYIWREMRKSRKEADFIF